MNLSMYQASVPVFTRGLTNLRAILDKAVAHAEAKKIDPSVLLTARLYPDMFTFTRQIQISSDTAKGCPSRLAGIESPRYEDTETTIDQLRERIDKTIAYLGTLTAAQIDGSEERTVTIKNRQGTTTYTGMVYLLHSALPNFFFHTVTAYDILRHNGVELGKGDYLGRF